jgi:hypothetical protein
MTIFSIQIEGLIMGATIYDLFPDALMYYSTFISYLIKALIKTYIFTKRIGSEVIMLLQHI